MRGKNLVALGVVMLATAGVSSVRLLPPYAKQRFSTWFKRRAKIRLEKRQARVTVFPTCLVEYQAPEIGHDLVLQGAIGVGAAEVEEIGQRHAGARLDFAGHANKSHAVTCGEKITNRGFSSAA